MVSWLSAGGNAHWRTSLLRQTSSGSDGEDYEAEGDAPILHDRLPQGLDEFIYFLITTLFGVNSFVGIFDSLIREICFSRRIAMESG